MTSSPPRAAELPASLGPYVVGPVIGIGGAAVVVRARDERLDADVAIKILRAQDPEIAVRFLREARLLRRVTHPAVVTVHDVGETPDGRPFLVMDLAECSLGDRLKAATGPADDTTLRAVVRTLADGLGALHRVGVIHRDIKPANLLVAATREPGTELVTGAILGADERLLISDLGFAKDQRTASAATTLLGGTPGYRAPEQLEYGRTVDARADVYGATAVLWLLVTGRRPPLPETLAVDLLAVPEPWRAVFGCGMAEEPDRRFTTIGEWAGAVSAAMGDEGARSAPATPRRAAPAAAAFPYKGLSAFQPEDAPLFFGRAALLDSLVPRLAQRPTLVIGGPSGSGKSSLLRAGLVPRLEAGALPGSAGWRTCLFSPGSSPVAALEAQLAGHDRDPLLVAVDQLEELFTLCPDERERQAFLARLDELTRGAAPRARVVLAVRADFYATCAAYPWLAAAVNANQVLVGPMTKAELREAIEGPARRVGLHLQAGLADRMLADTGDTAGALPLLAHALVETWLRREGDVLTLAGYAAAGGVAGALERTADAVWEQIDASDRPAARRLLLRLVQPGDGTPDTRRALPWRELGEHERNRLLVARFAEARLLTLDAEGVQVAHEALLQSWGRLRAWLAESRDELRAARRIESDAREWERQERHPDLLYRGLPLELALDWRQRQDGDVGEPAAAFLAAAEAARDAAERAERERQRRSARLRRRALAALATLTGLAVVTSAVAVVGLQRSRRDAEAAREANAAAGAQLAMNLAGSNPYLATMFAAQAVSRTDPPPAAARDALVHSRVALAGDRLVPYGDPIPAPDALALAVRPAGDFAATGARSGTVTLWDLATRERAGELTGPAGAVQGAAFTADGRWLVAGTKAGQVWVWDVGGLGTPSAPGAGRVVAELGAIVWSVAAAPTGTIVAVATQAGEVALLDAATGATQGDRLRPGIGDMMTVAFADGGSTLLAGSGSGGGQVAVWALPGGTLRYPIVSAHTSRILYLTVCQTCSPASFATVSSDGTARLWDLATGQPLPGGPFDEGADGAVPEEVRGAAFGPDGDTLVLGGPDGALYAWSVSERRLVGEPVPAHRDRLEAVRSSADGLRVVSLSGDQTLQVWSRAPRPDPVTRIADLPVAAWALALSPDAGTLAVGLDDGSVRVLDAADGRERATLTGSWGAVRSLAFLGPGRLAAGYASGAVAVWDPATGTLTAERPDAHAGAVTALAGAGDGDGARVLTGGEDGFLRQWRDLAGDPEGAAHLGAPVTDLAPDGGSVLATTHRDQGELVRWTPPDSAPQRLTSVRNAIWAVAADGGRIAVARADAVLSAWLEGGSGGPSWEQGGHGNEALDVAWVGPATLASGADDGRLRLWDAASGVPLGPPLALGTAKVRQVAAEPGGLVWAVDEDGVVTRVDALVLEAACAAAAASVDARQRARLQAGGAPAACQ